uniref:HTH psq-type domain-containing protein n=1 Tax=Heterorhabditis bacteriophora TaxID=37862 RepID=A0A1I7WBD0_HETBA
MTLHSTVKRYQELRAIEIILGVKDPDSKRPMRKMTSNLNISPTSMRRVVKHKLGFHPYEINRTHMFTEKMKVNR